MVARISQRFTKWSSLLVVVVMTGGCGNDRPEFDLSELPVARNLWTICYGRRIYVEGFSDSEDYYIGNEKFSGVEAVCSRISSIIGKMDEKEGLAVYFQLPKNFPAEIFAQICNETPELISGRAPVYLECQYKEDQIDSVSEPPQTGKFMMGPIVSNLDRVHPGRKVFLQTLEIAADYYLFGDRKFTWDIPLYSEMLIFTEVAAVGDETPVLRIVLHQNVTIQRLVSALDFMESNCIYKIFESK